LSHWETKGASDEWYTPKYIFDALGCKFDLDVAAPEQGPLHVPAAEWYFRDSLSLPWSGFVWMNPPFGGRNGIVPWLAKFFAHGNGIALVPDRTSAPWFQSAADIASAMLFLKGKVRFIRPDGSEGKSPSCGTVLFSAGELGTHALMNAKRAGLGLFVIPLEAQ
jgi:hypothetical protein